MDPILRRSSFYYVTSLFMYMSLMGRYMLTRDWPVFEILPLFVPIWVLGALFASESDECYAFLRMLPVPDRRVARTWPLVTKSPRSTPTSSSTPETAVVILTSE